MTATAVYCKADTLLKRGGINRKEKGSAHRATLCNEVTSAVRKIIGIEITLNPEILTLTYKKKAQKQIFRQSRLDGNTHSFQAKRSIFSYLYPMPNCSTLKMDLWGT